MAYPMVKPWLEYKRLDEDEYEVENLVSGEEPVHLPYCIVHFIKKLDGRTNPYTIDPSFDKKTARPFLRILSRQGFLRKKVCNPDLGRFAFAVVKFDGAPRCSRVSVILNRGLMLFWVPILVGGMLLGVKIWDTLAVVGRTYFFCLFFGLIIGLALHEAGHTIAAKAYRAPVYEVGIRLSLVPIAYSIMRETDVKNRLKRTQIYAAGVETNFAIAGLLLALAFFARHDEVRAFLFYAAIENLLLGAGNLCFFFTLDGFKMVTTLLGADDMPWSMLLILIVPGKWKKQIKSGASGFARTLCIFLCS